ncbi:MULTISPECIES: hypothetical protein [unclassified Mucilaginibacter]|mgnify:CR=1 FL=1|uniref:hypothetical protein n=1 Tax=unclassified Mucilaginibacter TaxID=2617802 RepID=UPI000A7102DE|nr:MULTISPECIES: hypothetical protein [unclassified Mucilaginibacter]
MMMETFEHILLFKTNISHDADKLALGNLLKQTPEIEHWNIDMEDEDRVLRIVSHGLTHSGIIDLLTQHGYECCELV